MEEAERGARSTGHPPSARSLELVAETLRAAIGDAEFRQRVREGRVERERTAATLGTIPENVPSPARKASSEKRREVAQAERELKRLKEELARANATEERLREQVERAGDALRRDKDRLAESKRESARLQREVKAADRRAAR